MDTGITGNAKPGIPAYFSIRPQAQCPGRALSDTGSAVNAQPSGFGIMAIFAVDITALKKNSCPVSGAIHTAEWYDLVYNCLHQRTFLSSIWPFLEAPRPRPVVF